ncbi:MAG: bifunctional DNA primase/polymerase [Planctomycetota bacterium]
MVGDASSLLDAARWYHGRGYAPIPLPASEKRPAIRGWNTLRLSEDDLPLHFNGTGNIGLLLGEPSGWLVDVDLDCDEAVALAGQYLPPTGAVTGRGGRPASHRWYVCERAATVKHKDPTGSMVVELRSTGAQTVVGPSVHPDGEAYDPLEGEPAVVPAAMLTACVKALADAVIERRHGPPSAPAAVRSEPRSPPNLDLVGRRAAAYLDAMPAAVSGQGGHGRTYAAATALVHGFELDPEAALQMLLERYNPRCDPPWSEKELRHKVEDAASKPHDRPRGWLLESDSPAPGTAGVDISAVVAQATTSEPNTPPPTSSDPGPMQPELLRLPGFVGEVMDHCMAGAPYPNQTLAFCGALSLLAMLAGRKVRDPGDNRTNMYLLGLSHSSGGKDWPRKVNTQVLQRVGLASSLGEQLASGEGMQDALLSTPAMLFQTDEIDTLLQSMKRARDARYESIMATLLTMYSSSNSVYPMRRRANNPDPGVIDQPCLVLFGTAIPNHYYAALSERMLTNGLFARMIVLESGRRPPGQEPGILDPPERVVETAAWWANFKPGSGNLGDAHPVPKTIAHTAEAKRLLIELRLDAERSYSEAEAKSDAVATTVWGRVSENARKLALLYAISENHRAPEIGADAVRWASALILHQTRRMLYMADGYAADGEFDELALKLLRKLREADGYRLPHSVLPKRMKLDAKAFRQLVETLIERGDVAVEVAKTAGRDSVAYRLAGNQGEQGVKEGGAE